MLTSICLTPTISQWGILCIHNLLTNPIFSTFLLNFSQMSFLMVLTLKLMTLLLEETWLLLTDNSSALPGVFLNNQGRTFKENLNYTFPFPRANNVLRRDKDMNRLKMSSKQMFQSFDSGWSHQLSGLWEGSQDAETFVGAASSDHHHHSGSQTIKHSGLWQVNQWTTMK